MSKPCYTCGKPFVNTKKQFLYEKKISEAHEYAEKNKITGAIAIVPLMDGEGFKIVESTRLQDGEKPREFILFSEGVAL